VNPLALIALASALALAFISAVVAADRPLDATARIYLALCTSAALYAYAEFQMQATGTSREVAEFWLRVRGIWPVPTALLLHFVMNEAGVWKSRWWSYLALYLPAVCFWALNVTGESMVNGVVRTTWGWLPRRAYGPMWYVSLGWGVLITGATTILCLEHWRRARDSGQRRRARQIALAMVAPMAPTLAADGLLGALGIDLPRFGVLGALIASILIFRAVRSRRLVLSPAAVADLIVSNMSDLLFLTDAEGRIQRTNRAAQHMLGRAEAELVGRPAEEVLPPLREPRGRSASFKELETEVKTHPGRSLVLSLTTSSIRDEHGNLVGMLFIGRDITDRKRAEASRELVVRGMIQAQDEERRRIARELHDETGQVLGSLIAELRVLEDQLRGEEARGRVGDVRNLVTLAMQEVQRISRGMHPGILDALGLAAALQHLADEFARLHGIEAHTEILGLEGDRRLPVEVETTVYRVVQEALTNVARHAEAKTVSLFVVRQDELLRAIVEDDGKGFDPDAARREPGEMRRGLGLASIRERVGLLGGSVRLETAPGDGVTLKIELPLVRGQPSTAA
jgi:PAS domain S-box-containing protein